MEDAVTALNGSTPASLPFDWAEAAQTAGKKSTPEGIRAAAAEFEALLVGQMLRSMREAGGGGWLGGDTNDAAFSLMEMAEQCLAAALASQGGLGLARLVEDSLADAANPGQSARSEPGHAPTAPPG
jgi:flagellar protein FlgJ